MGNIIQPKLKAMLAQAEFELVVCELVITVGSVIFNDPVR